LVRAGQQEGQPLGIAAARVDMNERAFDYARAAAVRAIAHGARQFVERQIALVRRTRKPLGGYPSDALAAAHVHSVTAAGIAAGIKNLHVHGTISMTGAGRLSSDPQPVMTSPACTLPLAQRGLSAHEGLRGGRAKPQAPRQG